MDFKWLYTGLEGRISRKQWWIGVILLAIAGIILSFIVMSVMGVSMFGMAMSVSDVDAAMAIAARSSWASMIAFVIMAFPSYALCLKRRHDRGAGGLLVLISLGLSALGLLVQAFGLGFQVADVGGTTTLAPSVISMIISLASFIVGIYLLVVLGFLKGTAGANAYGADPLA